MTTKDARRRKARADAKRETLSLSVPAAGHKYFGLSIAGSYAAAARGEIPTIRIGRLLKVPVARMEKLMRGGD